MPVVIIVLGLHKRRLKMSRNFLGHIFEGQIQLMCTSYAFKWVAVKLSCQNMVIY